MGAEPIGSVDVDRGDADAAERHMSLLTRLDPYTLFVGIGGGPGRGRIRRSVRAEPTLSRCPGHLGVTGRRTAYAQRLGAWFEREQH